MRIDALFLAAALLSSAGGFAQTQADLFDDTVLHEIRISMKPAAWADLKLQYLNDIEYTVDSLQWTGNGVGATINNVTVHNRGRGSRSPVKPGLHVNFDGNVKGQTFFGLKNLDLKNNVEDPSEMHDRLSMMLSEMPSLRYSLFGSPDAFMNGSTTIESMVRSAIIALRPMA